MSILNGPVSQTLLPGKPAHRRPLISLTPLIDVVFILLVFFMLASSFLNWRAIDVQAPVRLVAGAAASAEGVLLIEVTPQGLRFEAEALTLAALVDRVRERLAAGPESRILIRPAEGVPLQRIVDVVDRLKEIGVVDLSLTRDAGA